ncbi:MAG: DUF2225 domain-containing protein [Schwartzia sp.]|nr:DUF2225 domain-containing protein [Schwartzia sp. (in: firmicutes)]
MADVGFTYVVEKNCPVCTEKTHVVKVRSRLMVERTDWDYCTHYKDFNPYYYNIWVCEHCGFAADEKTFLAPMPEKHRNKLWEFVSSKKINFKFTTTRGLPEAIAAYKLAILFSEMRDEALAHQAGLYLKLAWSIRTTDGGNPEMEKPFLAKAAELYDRSVMTERYPIGPLTDSMAIYLTGAINYLMGDIEQATTYISRLMSDKDLREVDPKLYDRARDLWQDVRESK